jgi:hypothetical protein
MFRGRLHPIVRQGWYIEVRLSVAHHQPANLTQGVWSHQKATNRVDYHEYYRIIRVDAVEI